MTLPLLALGIFAAIGGFIGIWNNYGSQFIAGNESLSFVQQVIEPLHKPIPMLVGIAFGLIGIFLAFSLYKNATSDPLPAKLGGLATAMKNKFYFDEIYEATLSGTDFIAAVADWIDRWILEGAFIGPFAAARI